MIFPGETIGCRCGAEISGRLLITLSMRAAIHMRDCHRELFYNTDLSHKESFHYLYVGGGEWEYVGETVGLNGG